MICLMLQLNAWKLMTAPIVNLSQQFLAFAPLGEIDV
jgi:hypothetical protein